MSTEKWDESESLIALHRAAREDNMLGSGIPLEGDEWDDENSLCSLKERMKRAVYFLAEETQKTTDSPNYDLENELLIFCDEIGGCLDAMNPADARQWMMENIGAIEELRATGPKEQDRALRALVSMRGGADYTADYFGISNPAPTNDPDPDPAPTEEEDGGIPWDDDDPDGDEGEFHAAATREIVAAYRQTATCIRENLIARFRAAAARLGLQAAEHAPDPWRRGLNGDLGHFMGRVEVMLRGICPLEAHVWLESNIEEFESLRISTPREYDQSAQVLAVLSDRLFGLIYEIAREK